MGKGGILEDGGEILLHSEPQTPKFITVKMLKYQVMRDVFDPLDRDVLNDKYVYWDIVVPLDKVVHRDRDVQATKIVQPCKKTKFQLN